MATKESPFSAQNITLSEAEHALLQHLVEEGVQTEFELIAHVAGRTKIPEQKCQQEIGNWLIALRRTGMVWAGIATNDANVGIWTAAATKRGKDFIKGPAT